MERVKRIIKIPLIFSVMILIISCGGHPKQNTENTERDQVSSESTGQGTANDQKLETDQVPEKYALGKKIYDEKCVVCHQADGSGMVGAFPPLKNSDYLLADPVRGIHQTLNGSYEEMVVNGVTYNAPMTPQVDTKEEALAVINYVLKYFNDSDVELTMDDIRGIEIKPREE